jgi:hypothetical protein
VAIESRENRRPTWSGSRLARKEAKLDAILKAVDTDGKKTIAALDASIARENFPLGSELSRHEAPQTEGTTHYG